MRTIKPKGILVPIGGGEDKEDRKEVLSRIIKETGKTHPKICLITLATGDPKDKEKTYRIAFKALGVHTMEVIHYEARTEADTKDNLLKLKQCNLVMFSGGDQLKLTSLFGGTKLMDIVRQRYYDEPEFVVAGTSAGAAAMSDTMIISGSSRDAMVKGELELTNGLDMINGVFIDTHFTERGRIGRMIQTVTCNPGVLGIGLGEDTAIVLHKGDELEVVGSGLVMIVDGTSIDYTDLNDISNGTPITVEGMKVHVLGPGKYFKISERCIRKTKKKLEQKTCEQ